MSIARSGQVRIIYRRVIKELFNYSSSRAVWGQFIKEARAKFEENKNLKKEQDIIKKIDEGFYWLKKHKHPEPYRYPTSPGGSKFQRNVPPDLEIIEKFS
ncbi:hypothetical protein AAMO2058_000669900 [Amorphochlora amoebiformis]